MGRKRCVNPRFSRWLNNNLSGSEGSSSSSPPMESPPQSPPQAANPATPPPPSVQTEDYGLPPTSPPPNPVDIIDLEEEIDDEEYARRLHVSLNKGTRNIPANAEIISLNDSDDDSNNGELPVDVEVPADSTSASFASSGNPPNTSSGPAAPASLINSAKDEGAGQASSDDDKTIAEDADEEQSRG